MPGPLISVVAPVFNESEHLVELHRAVTRALDPVTHRFELILVDDGSQDDSAGIIERLRATDPRVGLVQLSRNFGKEAAMIAGYDHARGAAVIMMDADLQTPASVLPSMIQAWQQGAEIVDAVRTQTAGQGLGREWASRVFYWLIRRLANTEIIPDCVDFRLMDARAVHHLRQCRERFRFNRGLISWIGFKRTSIEFEAPERPHGQSRWGTLKLFSYAVDAVLAFSSLPLRLAGVLGLAISALSLLYLVFLVVYRVFVGQPTPGYATVVGGIFLLGGVQLLTIWLLGEYVGRLYEEIKSRPLYIAARVLEPSTPAAEPGAPSETPAADTRSES